MHQGRIVLRGPDAAWAIRCAQALAPDDPGTLTIETHEAELILEATGATPRSVLRTLDDALGCLRATGVP